MPLDLPRSRAIDPPGAVETSDFVVVGGGSAGCVVAGRLSEDPATSVALLEAGGRNDDWIVKTPFLLFVMVASGVHNWAFTTVPQEGLAGRRGYQPRGKGLGGSSAINAMVYIRGHRCDYDGWAALGNHGWSYEEVLPYFKKAEDNESFADRFHGQGGPLPVSWPPTDNPTRDVYLQAGRQAGFDICPDFNGADQEGIGLYQVTQKNGERWSAARAYIQPFLHKRRNLRVETHAYATRLLFDGRRAIGVEYEQHGRIRRLLARREVIVSSGVFQSPQLLMLSGVGDGGALGQLGIPVTHHLPGVGQNLHDHPDFVFAYTSDEPHLIGLSAKAAPRVLAAAIEYVRRRRGPMASNIAEGGGFLKTRPDLPSPDLQLHFGVTAIDDHGRRLHPGQGFSCHVALLHPKSRGSVRLQSADPAKPPAIDPKFLDEPEDLEAMVAGFKLTRKLMDAPALRAMRIRDMFTAGIETDDDIRSILRSRVDTVYHPVGTCKMGVNDPLAVVDPALKVHGLEGVRIADASVMPVIPGGNTNAPTIMIGEKAADLIRADKSRSCAGYRTLHDTLVQ
jgi:choline dehydrogenase-like flavoprotein